MNKNNVIVNLQKAHETAQKKAFQYFDKDQNEAHKSFYDQGKKVLKKSFALKLARLKIKNMRTDDQVDADVGNGS